MAKRKGLSKKTRFEVFKRDGFKCQYCGACSPDVVLVIDHIEPVSKGGTNAILNLITSCDPCNSGKSDRLLSDDTALTRQRAQLESLNERREQLEMMVQWQKTMVDMDAAAVDQLAGLWATLLPGWSVNDLGKAQLRKMLIKHSPSEIIASMKAAAHQYVDFDDKGKPTHESASYAWSYIPRIAAVKAKEQEKPYLSSLLYVRGICRNRFGDVADQREALALIERAYLSGNDIESLKEIARSARDYQKWLRDMDYLVIQGQ